MGGLLYRYADSVEALAAQARGDGLIVDVRDPAHYQAEHLDGATNASAEAQLLALPRDVLLFLYCT